MAALKQFKIVHGVIAGFFVALAATALGLGLAYAFLDALGVGWILLSVFSALLLGFSFLMLHRSQIGSILTRRCDVDGYDAVYRALYGKRDQKHPTVESVFQKYCVAFYRGEFEEYLKIAEDADPETLVEEPEMLGYLAYSAYRVGNGEAVRFVEDRITRCVAYSKRKPDELAVLSFNVVNYVNAMTDRRYADARAALPPRKLPASERYFYVFARFCFAEAEEAIGAVPIADRIYGEIASVGGTLWFAEEAKRKLAARK